MNIPLLRIAEEPAEAAETPLFLVNSKAEAEALASIGIDAATFNDFAVNMHGRPVYVFVSNNGYVAGEAPRVAGFAKRNGAAVVKRVQPPMNIGEDAAGLVARGWTAAEFLGEAEITPEWNPAPARTDAEILFGDDRLDDLESAEILDRRPKIEPEAFYGLAGDVVRRIEPLSEADSTAVLIQFLAASSNMLGRGPFIQVGATRHHLNLFVVLIGLTSAGRKGTSWDAVKYLLRAVDPEWAAERIQSGLVSGEGLIHHVRDERYEVRETKDRAGAAIREKVLVDPGVSDKRTLVVESEFSRPLKAASRDSNTLTDVLRQLWESGDAQTLGKVSPSQATAAHVSVIAHTTPADIAKYLIATDLANGTANRFLWCYSSRSKFLPEGGDFDAVDWSGVQGRLRRVKDFAARSGSIKLTRDATAKKMWAEVYREYSISKPGTFGAVVGRAVPQILRLSGIYAVLDESSIIRPEHLTAAVCLWNYCEQSARLVFGKDDGDPRAEKLAEALRVNPAGLSRTEIYRDVFCSNLKAEAVAKLLGDLLTQGVVDRQKIPSPSGRGRPSELWFLGRNSRT